MKCLGSMIQVIQGNWEMLIVQVVVLGTQRSGFGACGFEFTAFARGYMFKMLGVLMGRI